MSGDSALATNLTFWHWYPKLLVAGLTPEQLRWQPANHDTSLLFAIWHAYRSTDDICHGLVFGKPTVFETGGWKERLPLKEKGANAFGNGMGREQIGRLDYDIEVLLDYAQAVGRSLVDAVAASPPEALASEIALPFFTGVYEGVDRMSRFEALTFFAIGHVAEHLGEVQMVKGMMGMRGAPL